MKTQVYQAFALIAGTIAVPNAIGAEPSDVPLGSQDVAALHTLWNNYQQAITKKDTTALLGMYVSGEAPVLGGIAPKSYAVISAANKQPVPRTLPSTAKEEVTGEVRLPPDQTENLDIHSDGEVGSVSWDYKAKIGHGRIIWTTVHTNDGWKIASVVYSINVPAADSANASK